MGGEKGRREGEERGGGEKGEERRGGLFII